MKSMSRLLSRVEMHQWDVLGSEKLFSEVPAPPQGCP